MPPTPDRMAPEPRIAIRLIMRRSVTPAPRAGTGRALGGATAREAPADGGPRRRLLRRGAGLQQPLGEIVLLRPAALLAAARAIALDLPLEHGEGLLEREAWALGREVGVQLGAARQGHGDRAARRRTAPGARL